MKRILAVFLLCVVLQGQDSASNEERSPGRRTGPFLLSISSDKQKYLSGEAISITSVLRNESDREVVMRMSSPLRFYGMEVILPGPAWLPVRNRAVLSEEGQRQMYPGHISSGIFPLKPGEESVAHFEMSKLYVMTIPGEYHVVFYFRAPYYVGGDGMVKSNEIVFTIAEKN
jgi:hypothetical protein